MAIKAAYVIVTIILVIALELFRRLRRRRQEAHNDVVMDNNRLLEEGNLRVDNARTAVEGFHSHCFDLSEDFMGWLWRSFYQRTSTCRSTCLVQFVERSLKLLWSFVSQGKEYLLVTSLVADNHVEWALAAIFVYLIPYLIRGWNLRLYTLEHWPCLTSLNSRRPCLAFLVWLPTSIFTLHWRDLWLRLKYLLREPEDPPEWTYLQLKVMTEAKYGHPLHSIFIFVLLIVDLNPLHLWSDVENRLSEHSPQTAAIFLLVSLSLSLYSWHSLRKFKKRAALSQTGGDIEDLELALYGLGRDILLPMYLLERLMKYQIVVVTFDLNRLCNKRLLCFARAVRSSEVLQDLTLQNCEFFQRKSLAVVSNVLTLILGCRTLKRLVLQGARLPHRQEDRQRILEVISTARITHMCSCEIILEGYTDDEQPREELEPLLRAAWEGNLRSLKEALVRVEQENPGRLVAESVSAIKTAHLEGGFTALHIAAMFGHTHLLKELLLVEGILAKVNTMQDAYGATPLFWAAEKGEAEASQLLLLAGSQPDLEANGSRGGKTPLRMAAQYGHVDVIRVLLRGRADVNHRNAAGDTALHIAAQEGQLAAVQQLLQAQAQVEQRNIDIAEEYGHTRVARTLQGALSRRMP